MLNPDERENIAFTFVGSTIKNGFVGRMNRYSGFMASDTRGRTIDLEREQWSRVYNSYEGSGQ